MLKPRIGISLALTLEEGENVNELRKHGVKLIDIFRAGLEVVNKKVKMESKRGSSSVT